MEPHQHPTFVARLPANVKSWLKARASDNRRSRNAELLYILVNVMRAEPLYATARRRKLGKEEFFTAALGNSREDCGSSREIG